MSGQDGINVVLKVDNPLTCDSTLITCDNTLITCDQGAGLFEKLAGQVSTTLNLQASIADKTNKNGLGWQGSLATTRGGDISVSGILDVADAVFDKLKNSWLNNKKVSCQLDLDLAGRNWTGDFYVESMPNVGDIGAASKYDFSLKSDGVLTYT